MPDIQDRIRSLLEVLAGRISPDRLMDTVAAIWRSDRWFTNPKFRETHEWSAQAMRSAGVDAAEVVSIPADGRTRSENWLMPRAWDCTGAALEMIEPERRVLADWRQTPQCVVQWCGPTPPGGLTAELVCADELDPKAVGAARGRLVLTSRSGRDIRVELETWQAAGAVSYFLRDYIPDRESVTCWTNSWSVEPGGWAVHAGEPEMPGFNLPPAVGLKLAELLKAGKRVVLHARADTRLYDGILPVSTAVVRGRDRGQEVLLLGHAAEVGANDNASGCAAMMEALGVLAGLIRDGSLPRPRRSMRILLTSEIYGTMGFAGQRDDISRAMAALHFDIVGDGPSADRPVVLFEQGPTNPTYANELVAMIDAAMPARFGGAAAHFVRQRYAGVADDMISDPAFGPPCPWMGRPTRNNPFYHSSGDTPDRISPTALAYAAATGAAYLYFIASASDAEAAAMADAMIARARARWTNSPGGDAEWLANYRLKAEALRSADLACTPAGRSAVIRMVNGSLAGCDDPLPDLEATPSAGDEAMLVGRRARGVLSFQGRDAALVAKYPWINWDQKIATALYWADGRRSIGQLKRLTQAEWGPFKTDLPALFKAAADCGMVELKSPENE